MDKNYFQQFIERVDSLPPKSRIAMKHAAGLRLIEAESNALSVFYSVCTQMVRPEEEECWFFVACIRCLWEPDDNKVISMPRALADYIPKASESFQTRVLNILDTRMDNDGFFQTKMYRLVRLMKQQGYVIDAADLLRALVNWNSDSRWVQRQWIKEIVTVNKIED